MKDLTLDDVTRMFPDRALALYRVQRGHGEERAFTWKATWRGGYFTSDTDRHALHDPDRDGCDHDYFGATPGQALAALVRGEIDDAKGMVAAYEAHLAEARAKLEEVVKAIEGAP